MGIVVSKGDNNTPLINLCKERKELISAARDARYNLARSHLLYFKSLLGFSNALNQFVHNELTVIPYSDDDSSSSDLICSVSDSDSDLDSDSDCLVCHQSQTAPLINNDDPNMKIFGFGDGACGSSKSGEEDMEKAREVLVFEEKFFVSAPTETEMRGSQNFSHVQENNAPVHDILGLYDFAYNTQWSYIEPDQRDGEVESDGFREVREREGIPDLEPASDHNRKNQKKKKKNVKERSSVAGKVDKIDVEAKTCNDGEVVSDGFREVREREGIPHLEPESDHNRKNQKKKKKKKKAKNVKERSSVAGEIDKIDVEAKTCNGQVSGEVDNSNETCAQKTQKTPESSNETCAKKTQKTTESSNVTCAQETQKIPESSNQTCPQETQKTPENVTEGVTRLDEEVCDEGYESSSSTFSESSCTSDLTDLRDVVKRINRICEKAVSNNEISELLEVSRVDYHQPLGSHFIGFASRVLGSSGNSTRDLLLKRGFQLNDQAGSLSMSLEKLLMWEKKLHAEVTVEEKLRISYDKAYKILKDLDNKGAEFSEIAEAETVVKLQLSKINVSVRAVESISMRIHKIRDEELSFQVIEIINGFKKMWRFLAKCHHKQFQVISKSKSCVHIVEKGSSSRKATHKVEEQIRRYRDSLRGYVDAQRSLVKLLNEWLNRNIMEDGETEIDKAPEIFRVCREWLKEIENVDKMKVLSAVEEMRLRFEQLGLKQVEEEKQRMRTERLSKELKRKTKEMEEIWETSNSGPTEKMMVEPELLSLRESVTQETVKHESVVREVNDTVSMSLQECLVHVFEALEVFCSDNFKAYQNIRILPTETLLLCQSKE